VPFAWQVKLGLQIRQPDVNRPSVAADRDPVAAAIVRAIDQETAHAGGAHLSNGDLLRACPIIAPTGPGGEAAGCWAFAGWAHYGARFRPASFRRTPAATRVALRGKRLTGAFKPTLLGAADAVGDTNLAAHRCSNLL
jgi:hypothetical protein